MQGDGRERSDLFARGGFRANDQAVLARSFDIKRKALGQRLGIARFGALGLASKGDDNHGRRVFAIRLELQYCFQLARFRDPHMPAHGFFR